MRFKMTAIEASDVKHENLREEGLAWNKPIEFGRAVLTPDDGSGPLEGFYIPDKGQGMVAWGDDMSDWLDADDLRGVFQEYLKDMS